MIEGVDDGVAIGDTFLINGVVLEVVEEHDGHYHLNAGDVDAYFTAPQLAKCKRVRVP